MIKRQIIELSISDQTQAQRLQAEVSRVYRRRIVPLIDRYCTRLSAPDRIDRIERLELDLGPIDPARLEQDLVEKVTRVLEQELAKKIEEQARQGQGSQTQSHLELLAIFARTGSLPWWADASRPRLLDDCGRYLLQEAPAALRELLLVLAREQKSLSRLVNHFDDDLLAGLLQVLGTGQAAWPEYLLPLNKVLCGLDPTDLFDFGPPVTETETAEGEDLLRAAIVQAPILKEMSPAGLRGTFLLRSGVLRGRDGAWLLQVERETYDVVLDRFPWGWEWVKLPWMEAPLRVEW